MDDLLFIGVCGILIGFYGGFVSYGTGDIYDCEAELPRSQECILIAVPEKNHEAVNRNTDSAASTVR